MRGPGELQYEYIPELHTEKCFGVRYNTLSIA